MADDVGSGAGVVTTAAVDVEFTFALQLEDVEAGEIAVLHIDVFICADRLVNGIDVAAKLVPALDANGPALSDYMVVPNRGMDMLPTPAELGMTAIVLTIGSNILVVTEV